MIIDGYIIQIRKTEMAVYYQCWKDKQCKLYTTYTYAEIKPLKANIRSFIKMATVFAITNLKEI